MSLLKSAYEGAGKPGKIPEDAEGTKQAKARMLEALEKSLGIVTTAAKKAQVCNKTHYTWLRDDPKYKEAVEALKDKKCDFVESALMQKVEKGDTPAIIFSSKCLLKKRGYYEKVQISGDKDEPLSIKVISEKAVDAALKAELDKEKNDTDTKSNE